VRVLADDGSVDQRGWAQVYERACRRASHLERLGVDAGDRVAVLGSTSLALIETLLAIWMRGATVVVLPLPLQLGAVAAFGESTRARLRAADVGFVAVDREQLALAGGFPDGVSVELLEADPPPGIAPTSPAAVDCEAIAVLQFTSGSTDLPKAVLLSHRAVTANLGAIIEAISLRATDRSLSWLPLYHDMGLIGLLLGSIVTGIDATFIPTATFVRRPGIWMRMVGDVGATVTAGPNFAYALAARLLRRARDLDLSSLRIALCGAEPIDPTTLRSFASTGAEHGLQTDVVVPCYGLAEASLAVTIAPPGRSPRRDTVDRDALAEHGIARAARPGRATVTHVALGRPVPGTAVEVVDECGDALPERHVGELRVASRSLMSSYLGDGRSQPGAGWLATGDLGYLADGEVHVCGRSKDVIIVNGLNIHPHQVEVAAVATADIRMGGAVAFPIDDRGREAIVVLCESRATGGRAAEVTDEVRRRITAAVGVAPRHVVLVAPKAIPKTSSGKLRRGVARDLFVAGHFGVVESCRGGP